MMTGPKQAFILGAGLGTRLRPYTDTTPKPMVAVGGVPMIDRILQKLVAFGVQDCVVNTHYKAAILKAHLAQISAPHIAISHEEKLLDTGGGIKAALDRFRNDFFVLSGDALWEDPPGAPLLNTLAQRWDPQIMDILIALQPVERMTLTKGRGDYDLEADGRVVRRVDKDGAYMFTSIRINAPHIFKDTPEESFSYLDLLDRAQQKGRLYGLAHEGAWHHISTPADLEAVDAAFKMQKAAS